MIDTTSSQGGAQSGAMEVPGAGHILEYARRLGWRRALLRGTYVAANQLATVSILDCFHLRPADINRALTKADGDYECRFLTPDELRSVRGPHDETMARILGEAGLRGDSAYVIRDGSSLVSIGLYTGNPTAIMNDLVVHFDPPAQYMYRGYTLEAYRGRRLHALGILRAASELFARGVPQLVTVCERTNYPATVSVLRMGWQPCGAIYRIGVGPWTRLGQTAAAQAVGMELRMRSAHHDPSRDAPDA
jgi:hypothetical protein